MRINYVMMGTSLTGGYRVLFEIANRLAARGHEVLVTNPEAPKAAFRFTGRVIHPRMRLLKTLWFAGLQKVRPPRTVVEKRLADLERVIPDCDVNVATQAETAYPVHRSAKGIPFIHMQHDETLFYADPGLRELVEGAYRLPLRRIANSTWLRERIRAKTGEDSALVCPGVDLNTFRPREAPSTGGKRRVVAFGRNAPWKGVPDLLEAMASVMSDRHDVELVLYGSEPISHRRAGVEYRFIRVPPDEELARLYSSADVVACPSWYESFPLVPIEAMACGAPVVTTRVGTEDYAIHEETALVVPPRDPRALAGAIRRVLDDEPLRERLRTAGRAKAREFTWARAVDGVEHLFRHAMG